MAAGTKRRKLPRGDSSSPPKRKAKRARRSKSQPTKQEESPSPGISTSSSSRSPSPIVEFYAPTHPKLARWRCCTGGCGRRGWPLAVRQCLDCGHERDNKCEDFIDYLGWKKFREWKRWRLFVEGLRAAGDYDFGMKLTPSSIFVPDERLDAVSQELENMESERFLLLGDGRHSCFTDCHLPGECKDVQRAFSRRTSPLSSKEKSQSPRPAMPDSPKSPPPSDDEDGGDVGWVDVVADIDVGSQGTKDEDADSVRPRSRLPSPLLPSDGAPKIYEDDLP
ncbi:unnamed protein product [Clonostachys solani]|uniref:Uncharacterized protein n=1 Tax=Clonostachys solani TaxID=160281 RepID=A0A9N9W8D5_9HYPO|nr:unnamed protein product [Clonostachys solani]